MNDMNVDGRLSSIRSAVSSAAHWHEPRFMCDKQCRKNGVQYFDNRISDGGRQRRTAHEKTLTKTVTT